MEGEGREELGSSEVRRVGDKFNGGSYRGSWREGKRIFMSMFWYECGSDIYM